MLAAGTARAPQALLDSEPKKKGAIRCGGGFSFVCAQQAEGDETYFI
jgi:hypothetical protein